MLREKTGFFLTMKPTRLFLLLASLWILSGCAAIGPSYPTPIPPDVLPTAIAQTAAALNATAFALTPSPTATPLPTDTPIPTITNTPTPIPPAPPARLHFLQPGPMSVLTSAIQTKLYLVPGETNLVQVALYGEDGRLLARDLTRVEDVPPPGLELDIEIPFEIRAIELGRLEASIKDKFGRYESLNSMHVTLLPVGLSQITPPDPPFERAAIYSPAAGANIHGGVLAVEGALWPVNDQPVILELQDEAGRIISTRQLSLTGNTYIPFTTTLPYKVSEPTPVRLSIRQTDPRFNVIAYLYSLLITLNP
ncbi:MAG: hypothetical protein C4583_11085 [Anaerolineaceae bacterium]|nr:MAG: hypothetical protein C4583_11085 [Anaerolineaceae bacterium]